MSKKSTDLCKSPSRKHFKKMSKKNGQKMSNNYGKSKRSVDIYIELATLREFLKFFGKRKFSRKTGHTLNGNILV